MAVTSGDDAAKTRAFTAPGDGLSGDRANGGAWPKTPRFNHGTASCSHRHDLSRSHPEISRPTTSPDRESVVACFTPGCLILTDAGDIPVEHLKTGYRVLTRDSGFQPIRWMARRDLTLRDLRVTASFNPVRIARGALGFGLPERDMIVSPHHRMMFCGRRAQLLFGEREVLVAATDLVGLPGVTQVHPAGISYFHFLFDHHEIVRADGAWSESFQPGVQTMAGLGDAKRQELVALFPDVLDETAYAAARLSLKPIEAAALLHA